MKTRIIRLMVDGQEIAVDELRHCELYTRRIQDNQGISAVLYRFGEPVTGEVVVWFSDGTSMMIPARQGNEKT